MIPELRQHVRDAARPLAAQYGLSVLPDFADVVAIAAFFFAALQLSLSPAVSKSIFPLSYGKADKRTRRNWDMHVASLVHALVVAPLALRCLPAYTLNEDRAFGTHSDASFLLAITTGYFIWDALWSIIHFTEFGFVVHGVACTAIYLLTTRPFVQYYGIRFLLWEVSTIFLNFNWFLDKMGKSGSQLQLANGTILLSSFFCFRLVWGAKLSYDFFVTLNGVYTRLPLVYILIFGTGNVVLQGLNWIWFTRMVSVVRKRFSSKSVEGNSNKHGNLSVNGTGKTNGHLD